jgi:chromate transporter
MTPTTAEPSARPANLRALFWAFTRLSMMGFGGVLPIAQRELVERQRWLSAAEFAELLSIGQVLPGPNVVNLALMVGDRYFGLRGAMVAVLGMIAAPMAVVLALAALYHGLANVPQVVGAVRGMGAVSAGLIGAMGLKLMPTLGRNPLGRALWLPVAAAAALAVGALRWPLWTVILGLGTISFGLAWWRLGQGSPRKEPPP